MPKREYPEAIPRAVKAPRLVVMAMEWCDLSSDFFAPDKQLYKGVWLAFTLPGQQGEAS
jgi:hypothetical protein